MRTTKESRKSFAINLLLEGRPVLVVGGGRVGWRKVQLLLDAGAAVTVVSPTAEEALREAAAAGRIVYHARAFEPADVEGAVLAFACANDGAVNRAVLAAARAVRVPGCAADGNWPAGDFVTPASVRRADLVVSVSTGGRSCRQSRLIKESLSRHLQALETSDLLVVGTSHELLPGPERERFHLVGADRERVGHMIQQIWGVHEFLILNTCNRIEVVAAVSEEAGTSGILRRLLHFDHLDEDRYYRKRGLEAFEHLCLVTAGMLSQSPGETHITAQVKEALEEARGRGWAGGMLCEWVDAALHVSKHVRPVVEPLLRGGEIEDVCLTYLERTVPDLGTRTVMVIGAGVVGRGLVEQCVNRGCHCLWCYHHNRPEVPSAWAAQVELCTLNGIKDRLGTVDVILSAVEAPGYVLHEGHAPFLDQERCVLVVDLAMPRNVDPRLDSLTSSLRVVDLDGLKHWYRATFGRMERAMERSRAIVEEHVALYERIRQSVQGGNAGEPAGADSDA